ncbi:MAG: hypothetical protein GOP50_06775 [Candidatus Heimdallarchaeota archaeon]|nr:hypothetical protein [Candidatus Heimdallarchaeota archaeon]
MSESNNEKMKEYVENMQQYVQQATLNRIKGVLESYVKEWGVEADILIPKRISYPKPIFLYLKNMDEIPMEVFDSLSDFSSYYDLKYINQKGKLFAFYIYKDYNRRDTHEGAELSLYEIYEKEKRSIIEKEEIPDESLYDYNIKKGIAPFVRGERESK